MAEIMVLQGRMIRVIGHKKICIGEISENKSCSERLQVGSRSGGKLRLTQNDNGITREGVGKRSAHLYFPHQPGGEFIHRQCVSFHFSREIPERRQCREKSVLKKQLLRV